MEKLIDTLEIYLDAVHDCLMTDTPKSELSWRMIHARDAWNEAVGGYHDGLADKSMSD